MLFDRERIIACKRLVISFVRQEYAVKPARDYWSALALLQGLEQTRRHLPGRLFFNLEDPRAKTIIGLLCASEEATDLTPVGPIAACDRARVKAGINAGHEALVKHYPEAAEAFNLLVSSILAIRVSGLSSGSHEHSIGMFWISPTASWIISDYAFAIAHETVHQLLFLENMVNPLFSCNRSELSCADALVSSPIRAQPRPFDLAFHAACVATVLSHLSTSARFDRFDLSVHERLRRTLTELDRKRSYLTDHGKNLLDDVIAQAGRITTEFGAERPMLRACQGNAEFFDPYPLYDALLEHGPYRSDSTDEPLLILSRQRDVASALLDERLTSTPQGTARLLANDHGATGSRLGAILSRQIEVTNGSNHRRLRGLLTAALSKVDPKWLRGVIRERVSHLFDSVRHVDTFDFVPCIAAPLPHDVMLDILGIRTEERERFAGAVQSLLGSLRGSKPNAEEILVGERAAETILAMATRWLAGAIKHNKLIETLIAGVDDYPGMSCEDLAANLVLLFAAGHGTTSNLLSSVVLLRLQNGAACSIEPARFVEEVLRYESPIQSLRRTASSPICFDAEGVPTGEDVLLLLGAANRDSARFHRSKIFDPARSPAPHVAFGLGPHICPGARIARMQAEEILAYVDNLPKRLLCMSTEADWLPSASTRGLRSLWLHWEKSGTDEPISGYKATV